MSTLWTTVLEFAPSCPSVTGGTCFLKTHKSPLFISFFQLSKDWWEIITGKLIFLTTRIQCCLQLPKDWWKLLKYHNFENESIYYYFNSQKIGENCKKIHFFKNHKSQLFHFLNFQKIGENCRKTYFFDNENPMLFATSKRLVETAEIP